MKTMKSILRAVLAITAYLLIVSAVSIGSVLLLARGLMSGLEALGLWSVGTLILTALPLMLMTAFWTIWVAQKYCEIVSRPAFSLLAIPEYRGR